MEKRKLILAAAIAGIFAAGSIPTAFACGDDAQAAESCSGTKDHEKCDCKDGKCDEHKCKHGKDSKKCKECQMKHKHDHAEHDQKAE